MTAATRRRPHRVRASIIGILECCRCAYPVERAATSTAHSEECPAHGMTLSAWEANQSRWSVVAEAASLDVETIKREVCAAVATARAVEAAAWSELREIWRRQQARAEAEALTRKTEDEREIRLRAEIDRMRDQDTDVPW